MKIAFVSYPNAALLPPYHGSMGASIYVIAREMAKSCRVVVYGLAQSQRGADSGAYDGVEYRFPKSSKSDLIASRLRHAASRIVEFSTPVSTSSRLYPSYGRQVAADLAKETWDIIHVQHCSQYIPEIRRLNPSAKLVLHIHTEWFSQSNFALLSKRIRGLDLLLTVSDFVTQKTRKNFPQIADRCETLYNGIDMQEFNEEKDYGASRSRKVKRFLYAGGIWPHKGPHIAIEAFKIVAEKYPDVHFDLVGPQGEYPLAEACDLNDSESIKTLAPLFEKERLSFIKSKLSAKSRHGDRYFDSLQTRLGEFADKVTFHGFVSRSRLVELYYDSDIFVFPPIWNEAFGCTPLEAMAAGLPVVVSRCGGLTETVQDGRTGLVVNANDCDVLAQAMLRLLEDDHLRERMGQAARQRAVQCFSWEWVVRSMESGYKSLCRGESSPHGFNSHLNPQVAEDSLKLARVRSGD